VYSFTSGSTRPDPRKGKKMIVNQKSPKVSGCLVCGYRTEEPLKIEMMKDYGCPICPKEMRSLFVEGREWFDKVNGNSYFSARIWINGGQVAILPFQYGYGDQFIYEAQRKLIDLGYISKENENQSLYSIGKTLGFDFYSSKTTTKKSEMFKHYPNYSEIKAGN
jgi:hypothetical protein